MNEGSVPIAWREPVAADVAALVRAYGPTVKALVAAVIADVKADPRLGDWLGYHPDTGDLSDCRKVRFGPHEYDATGADLGPALRFVYRLRPSNTDVDRIEIVAVAPRRALLAYHLASQRLAQDPTDT